ncbi:hypothetical protein [Variovorax sp. LT1R16]|uniref:hypothetical protein n=1 Tax=Variovorax sp. LT1R16 TaxID=3443728 RepID=UPI003F48D213
MKTGRRRREGFAKESQKKPKEFRVFFSLGFFASFAKPSRPLRPAKSEFDTAPWNS